MKKFLAAILTATMVLGLAACGGNAQTGGSGSTGTGDNTGAVTIKLGHGQTEAHPYHLGAAKFAELVDEYTNGTVKVEVYPNATLGAERDMVEGVSMGTVDACITTNAP